MVRTQIQLTEGQYAWLKRFARRKDISLSEAVRRCVDAASTAEDKVQDRNDMVRDARSVIGKYRHGDHDPHVGRNHDEHLKEIFKK